MWTHFLRVILPQLTAYCKVGFYRSSSLCANTTCTLPAADCDGCLVHHPTAVLGVSRGSCCASVSSDGTCGVGQESGENPSDDDDVFHGHEHEPEEAKQYTRIPRGW